MDFTSKSTKKLNQLTKSLITAEPKNLIKKTPLIHKKIEIGVNKKKLNTNGETILTIDSDESWSRTSEDH